MLGDNPLADRTNTPYQTLRVASVPSSHGTRHLRGSKHMVKLRDEDRVSRILAPALKGIFAKRTLTKRVPVPPKVPSFATTYLLGVYVTPPETHGISGQKILAVLLTCTLDNEGGILMVISTRVLVCFPILENLARRLCFLDSRTPIPPRPRLYVLNLIFCLYLEPLGNSLLPSAGLLLPLLHYPGSNNRAYSTFRFLKYTGPKRLRCSRKILLDQEGYQITHIGQGAFAVISRVLYRPTGDVRVMKRITFDDSGLAKYLAKNEVDALRAMSGNIWFPPLLNEFSEGGQFVITMPYYRRGDLAGYIEHKRHLGREVAQFYSAQLILAIQSLHKVGIIHRDIKPDNIFLDEAGHLVLADFGLAENIAQYEGGEAAMVKFPLWLDARAKGGDNFPLLWFDEHNPLSMCGIAGTFWYTAPEVFRKEQYSFGVDYWSVGVIYHELITGHIPFNHFKPYPENKYPVLDFRTKPGQLKDIAPWEEQVLSELLAAYPTGRPQTVTDIKNNRIFRGVDWVRMAQKGIPPPALPPLLVEG
ncbi:kinase-like protein [Pholiota conissans]|uniref:non-specific serine/threonine protein kinase n=1 Tax=Pholiota conissans TaxID=109636 RepID=A0A9P5ZD02_9AGAR|nr:kinase-like protein [Pholiota conissans]